MTIPVRAIASANGLAAVKLAYEMLVNGRDTLNAVVEGLTVIEDDESDLTVGYGGLPNEDGFVELDAAVMHGPSHRAGAVAGVTRTPHVTRLARLVMQETRHALLVGAGADEFARVQGFPEQSLLSETARKIWLYWKQTRSDRDDWLAPPIEQLDPAVVRFFKLDQQSDSRSPMYGRSEADVAKINENRPTGTVHCSAINSQGEMSCATSTSGLAFKIPGRVGDSPLVGAGLYVDNEVGCCGSTGRGEENVRNCSSHAAVELMRSGLSPAEAGRAVLERVVAHLKERWLLNDDGRPNFGLKLYLMNHRGEYAGVSLWGPTDFAVADEQGARLAPCEFLFEK